MHGLGRVSSRIPLGPARHDLVGMLVEVFVVFIAATQGSFSEFANIALRRHVFEP